jgi:alpha/beta superfamily hydrolase|tara:strand:+ start:492 stop:1142 length:651 start_codon:yes stop_codon:yes gene_type:complete
MPEVIFNGPEGRIEGRYHHANDPNAPVALLLHPHPEYGGTMNNRVVYAMYQAFVKRGFSTLRFNFRGVGRSQGKFDNGQGELSDAATALDWMQGHNPNASTCWIAGFSFGAWVSMQLMMRRPEISGFISASPPASIYDFSFLAPCPASGLLIHGKADEVVPVGSVDKLVEKLSSQKNIEIDYRTIDKCDHYFSEHLDNLLKHVEDYLDKRLVEKAA